jgi:hypothetical protein
MNWASSALGAKLVDWSSQVVGGEATNVLEDNENLWLSKPGTPQSVSISMKEVDTIVIRTVGWYCWHPYSTNPRKVSVHVSTDGSHFRHWDTLNAKSHARGNQLFSCAPIDTALYPFIAFEINNTFGGEQTYMNRIYMYSDEITASPDSSIGSHRRSLPVDEGSFSNIADSRRLHYAEHGYNERGGEARSPITGSPPARSQVSVRMSADTDAVAQQLQAALGIADEWDDSFVHYEDARDAAQIEAAEGDLGTSAVTVAGRIAHLEESVSQLTHTVRSLSQSSSPERATLSRTDEDAQHSYYSEQGQPSVGNHSRTSSPSRAHSPSVHRSGGNSALQAYEQRIHQLEDKLVSVLEVLEQRQAAGLPSMPVAPSETYSSHSPINASTGGPDSKSSGHRSQVRPPQPPPPPTPPAARHRDGANQNASYTTISNVTSSSRSTLRPQRDTHAFGALAELPQPAPWSASGHSAQTGAASLQEVEHLLRRVLDRPQVMDGITHADAASSPMRMSVASPGGKAGLARRPRSQSPVPQLHDQRTHFSASPPPHILRRAASPTEHVHREIHAHRNEHHDHPRRRERSRDRGTRRARSSEERLVSSSDSDSNSHGKRHTSPGQQKDHRDRGVRSYIAANAERLLRQERSHKPVQQRTTHTEQHHVSQTQQVRSRYDALARAAREGLRGRAERVGPEDSDSQSQDDALLASVHDSDESGAGTAERLRQLRAKRDAAHSGSLVSEGRDEAGGLRPVLAPSTSALDKNIFELLKVKYGLDAAAGSEPAELTARLQRDSTSHRVPHQHRGAGAHGAAVRRSNGHSGSRHSSTLPMHVPVEASHTAHSTVPVVDWGQYVQNRVASRSGSPSSPLRPGTPGVYTVAGVVVNSCDHIDVLARAKHDQRAMRRGYDARGVRTSAASQSGATGNGDAEKSRQLHRTAQTEDAEFETLVRQLQEKVLARTIKAAQYDMLRMSEGVLEDN